MEGAWAPLPVSELGWRGHERFQQQEYTKLHFYKLLSSMISEISSYNLLNDRLNEWKKTRWILFVCWKIKWSYRTKTCQNVALYTAGVCSDETAACLFLVFDKSVALHLVEIIESDTQSLSGFEFSIDFFYMESEICKERLRFEFCSDSLIFFFFWH